MTFTERCLADAARVKEVWDLNSIEWRGAGDDAGAYVRERKVVSPYPRTAADYATFLRSVGLIACAKETPPFPTWKRWARASSWASFWFKETFPGFGEAEVARSLGRALGAELRATPNLDHAAVKRFMDGERRTYGITYRLVDPASNGHAPADKADVRRWVQGPPPGPAF
jgi:hypothetical protein